MPEALRTVLSGLSALVGPMYGELSLKAKQLIDDSLVSSILRCIPISSVHVSSLAVPSLLSLGVVFALS